MRPAERRTDEELLAEVGATMRGEAEAAEAKFDAQRARARFVEAVARRTPPSHRIRRSLLLAAATAVVVAIALGIWLRVPRHETTFAVDGALVSSGGFVQASSERATVVRFSDASTITMDPGTRARVNEVGARGARISVESGRVHVEITKREGGADYVFEAGPHSVKVTGTRFDLAWDPSLAGLRLVLHEGAVLVTGPPIEAGVGVREGQTLRISPGEGVRLTETSAPATSETVAVAPIPPTASPDPLAARSSEAAASPSSIAPKEKRLSWAERVAAGDFAAVLAEADAAGIEGVIAGASVGDLVALADAARYGGRSSVAQKSLQAVRSRFGGTRAASTAAFLLGRMAEDGGRADAAIGFYDATLAEGSTFAAEALGRKMLLVRRRSGDVGARPIAESYLKSYPRGPYADVAKSIAKR